MPVPRPAFAHLLSSVRLLALAGCLVVPGAHAAAYRIETVTEGLDHPWSLAFLPDGRMLVTERVGRLRLIEADGTLVAAPVAGLPESAVARQAGLMDIALDPHFSENGQVYLSQAHGDADDNATRVIRARLEGGALHDVQPIFVAAPGKAGFSHFGGRMAFLPDGSLLLTLGDGFDYRESAQDPASHLGKIVRLNPDGTAPGDNPFADRPSAAPEVYSMGHRNVQGIVYDAQADRVYSHEHGPRGGDELNHIQAGYNYGWPAVTYGIDYTGARISPYTTLPGYTAPLLQWTPSIAPSGMALYRGDGFPEWDGDLFISTLVERSVRRVDMENGVPVGQEILFTELGERIRDVRTGPDGALYLLTDDAQGRVLRVTPDGR